MALPPTVGPCMGVSGTGREGDGGMFFDLEGVTEFSSNDE